MKILVCDDEKPILDHISGIVRECVGERAEIIACDRAESVLQKLGAGGIDLIFMDIDMPGMNGLEAAEHLKDYGANRKLVFVSSYDNLVFEGQVSFPLCSVRKIEAAERIPVILNQYITTSERNKLTIPVFEDKVGSKLQVDTIIYVQRCGRKCQIRCINGKIWESWDTLKNIHESIKACGFCLVNKSTIVNLGWIQDITQTEVVLMDNTSFELSRRGRGELTRKYMAYGRAGR